MKTEDKYAHLIIPKKGVQELISTLNDITEKELLDLEAASKLEKVDKAILRKVCKAMYIDQKFKKVIFN